MRGKSRRKIEWRNIATSTTWKGVSQTFQNKETMKRVTKSIDSITLCEGWYNAHSDRIKFFQKQKIPISREIFTLSQQPIVIQSDLIHSIGIQAVWYITCQPTPQGTLPLRSCRPVKKITTKGKSTRNPRVLATICENYHVPIKLILKHKSCESDYGQFAVPDHPWFYCKRPYYIKAKAPFI